MAHTNFAHPDDSRRIVIHAWMIEFAGSAAAGAVMSFFDYWHAINKNNQKREQYLADLREKHGQGAGLDISWEWQFHRTDDIADGVIIYGRTAIKEAIRELTARGVLESQSNPFDAMDRTKWFKFNPEPARQWLERAKGRKRLIDRSETTDRQVENDRSTVQKRPVSHVIHTNNTKQETLKGGSDNPRVRACEAPPPDFSPTSDFLPAEIPAGDNATTGATPGRVLTFPAASGDLGAPDGQNTPGATATDTNSRARGGAGNDFTPQGISTLASSRENATSDAVNGNGPVTRGALALATAPVYDARPETQSPAEQATAEMRARIAALAAILPTDQGTRQFSDLLFAATSLQLTGPELLGFLPWATEQGIARAKINVFRVRDLLPAFADHVRRVDDCAVAVTAFDGFDLDLVGAVLQECNRPRPTLTLRDLPSLLALLKFLRGAGVTADTLRGCRAWVERERNQTGCAIGFEFIQRNWARWITYRRRHGAAS